MIHDPLCPVERNPLARECRTCELIAKVVQRTLSTTDKTWGDRALNAERKLSTVRAQRDLLAERSGLPIPTVNGQTYK
jgi:hypothetical protein